MACSSSPVPKRPEGKFLASSRGNLVYYSSEDSTGKQYEHLKSKVTHTYAPAILSMPWTSKIRILIRIEKQELMYTLFVAFTTFSSIVSLKFIRVH